MSGMQAPASTSPFDLAAYMVHTIRDLTADSQGAAMHMPAPLRTLGSSSSAGRRCTHRQYVQGEVEQISMMKPIAQTPHETSLLEYLEDIIGTHTYVAPIEEAAKK